MVENYIIVERKDLEKDGIIAIPESCYHDRAKKVFEIVGTLSGLEKVDFRYDDHWCHNNIPIVLAGSLREPSNISNAVVKKSLETVCESQGLQFDRIKLLNDSAIVSQILDYEIVTGDMYIIRFSGKNLFNRPKDITRSVAYFLSHDDGGLIVYNNQLSIGGINSELSEELKYVMESDGYEGNLEAFNAGTLSLHRKLLKPYESRGKYGSPHSNGPWIVLQKNVSEKQIELMASFMKF